MASVFTSIETTRKLDSSGAVLDIKKNPVVISILDGVDTLKKLSEQGQIKPEDIQNAKGFLMMRTDKVGFGISITQGYGLVITRQPGSQSGWSAPLPIKVDGFSLGAVAGYSEQHSVISLGNDNDIAAFLKDKRSMKLGVDVGLAVGKNKKFNQKAGLNVDEITKDDSNRTKAFTISKGYLVDVSLHGTSIEPDSDDIEAAYGAGVTPADILTGKVRAPCETKLLYDTLAQLGSHVAMSAMNTQV